MSFRYVIETENPIVTDGNKMFNCNDGKLRLRIVEDNPWHTELPTEDGQYFVAYRWGLDNQIMHDMAKQICYGATVFSHGTWKVEFPFVVLAWQRIEPFKEKEK